MRIQQLLESGYSVDEIIARQWDELMFSRKACESFQL